MTAEKEYIVVAEDSPPNLNIIASLVKKYGFEAIPCKNGQLAWEAIEGAGDKNIVAVISDINMPEVTGIQLLRKVRESDQHSEVKFLLVTAEPDKDSLLEAKGLKVNAFILKPIDHEQLFARLQGVFPNRKFKKHLAA